MLTQDLIGKGIYPRPPKSILQVRVLLGSPNQKGQTVVCPFLILPQIGWFEICDAMIGSLPFHCKQVAPYEFAGITIKPFAKSKCFFIPLGGVVLKYVICYVLQKLTILTVCL